MLYNLFFIISGILWSIELYPQLYKTYKTKKTGDISLFYYCVCIIAYIFFLIGSALLKNWYLFLSHIVPFLNLNILMILIIKYRYFSKQKGVCKYWIELSNNNGLYEYCQKTHHRVICCGNRKECEYK